MLAPFNRPCVGRPDPGEIGTNETIARDKKRAVIFDLDGTLVNSMPFVVETFIYAVAPFRSRPSTEEILAQLGGPLETCLRNVLGPAAVDSFPEARGADAWV